MLANACLYLLATRRIQVKGVGNERWFSTICANRRGRRRFPWAFLLGVAATLLWVATGSYFHYSDTWQLVINTGASIGAFSIVFLIQNTQNRDAKVMQLKLDDLIRAVKPARMELVRMETMADAKLDELQREFQSCRDGASLGAGQPEKEKQKLPHERPSYDAVKLN
jgi:low affinity Fe/Cu permease